MTWLESLNHTGLKAGSIVSKSFHAVQDIPGSHRLFNAGLMGLGWLSGNWLREIIFAQKHDGTPVTREEVPAPMRFLHGMIHLNQFADDHENRWKKVVYQCLPAVGAALGAYYGSQLAFERNGSEQKYHTIMKKVKNGEKVGLLDADNAAAYAISKPLRVLAGIFGVFSAASGLTAVYGLFLGTAFAASSNRAIFPGVVKGAFGPAKAVTMHLKNLGKYVHHAVKTNGSISEEWAEAFSKDVLQPLFPGKSESEMRHSLQQIVDKAYIHAKATDPAHIEKVVLHDVDKLFHDANISHTLIKDFGFKAEDVRNANIGAGIPWLKWPVEKISKALNGLFERKGKFEQLQDSLAKGVPNI